MDPIVAVVTGANRGIGLAICKKILQDHTPVHLYACSRRGVDLGLKSNDSSAKVEYPTLDISNVSQIQALADQIKQRNGRIDVLINNAGTQSYGPDDNISAEQIMHVNYTGTLKMCQTFIPLVSKNGRIVNVSSTGSSLGNYSQDIQARFRSPKMTLEDLEQLAQEYIAAAKQGGDRSKGFRPDSGGAYSFSKACINALTAILARGNSGLTINACCPGWVNTDMGNIMGRPSKSLDDGAKIPLRLAFGKIDGVTGRYWGNPSVSDTGDGDVRTW